VWEVIIYQQKLIINRYKKISINVKKDSALPDDSGLIATDTWSRRGVEVSPTETSFDRGV